MVLMMAKQGGWTTVRRWPKTLKTKLNLKGDNQARLHSGQMVLVVVRQRGWTALTLIRAAGGVYDFRNFKQV
jgi:hypothetical protein